MIRDPIRQRKIHEIKSEFWMFAPNAIERAVLDSSHNNNTSDSNSNSSSYNNINNTKSKNNHIGIEEKKSDEIGNCKHIFRNVFVILF